MTVTVRQHHVQPRAAIDHNPGEAAKTVTVRHRHDVLVEGIDRRNALPATLMLFDHSAELSFTGDTRRLRPGQLLQISGHGEWSVLSFRAGELLDTVTIASLKRVDHA